MAPEIQADGDSLKHVEELLKRRGTPIEGNLRSYLIQTPDGEEPIIVNPETNRIIGSKRLIDRIQNHLEGLEIFGASEIPALELIHERPTVIFRDKILDKPLSDLDLRVRTSNSLRRHKITTIKELIEIAEQENAFDIFRSIRNFGEVDLKEVLTNLIKIEDITFDKSLEPILKEIREEQENS